MGWFTSVYPVTFRLPPTGAAARLTAVRDQLRAVPFRGIGYGLARYGRRGGADLAGVDEPQIIVNYHGRVDTGDTGGGLFQPADRPAGQTSAPDNERSHLISVQAAVHDGELIMDWRYSQAVHRRGTIEALAAEALRMLRLLTDPMALALEQAGLAEADVEDVYDLTAAQAGLLFESLAEPGRYAMYSMADLTGELDEEALAQAWSTVLARHPSLRTTVLWAGLDRPVQAVRRAAAAGLERVDLRGAQDAAARLETLSEQERHRGFDLAVEPGARGLLIRVEQERWRFIWASHHIFTDAWSQLTVWQEMLAVYEAARAGGEARLPTPVPYRRYADWVGERRSAGTAHWGEVIGDFATPTPLPGQRPGTAGSCRTLETVFAPEALTALRAVCRRHLATSNAVVQAVWGLMLSLYSGEPDVVFGSSATGRTADVPGIQDIVGLVTNTVPVRVRVDRNAPVGAWLAGFYQQYLGTQDNQHVALADVQRLSGVPAGTPLFDSIISFENFAGGAASLPSGIALSAAEGELDSGYGLDVDVHLADRLSMTITYHQRRFDAEVLAQVAVRFEQTLIRLAAAAEDTTLGDVLALAGPELDLVVQAWNATDAHTPEACVHEIFEARVRAEPDAVAVLDTDGRTVSYAELDAWAEAVAARLRRDGVGAESTVGVCVGHSPELIAGLLGVLKAGAAYVPLDPAHPVGRRADVLADARAVALVTVRALSPQVPPDFADAVVWADRDEPVFPVEALAEHRAKADPDNLAYVIYTSGSTGRPKGVQVSHRSLLNFLGWAADRWTTGSQGSPLVGSVAFDLSVPNYLLPLISGKSITILPADDQLPALVRALREPGADFSCLKLTPGHLEAMRNLLDPGDRLDSVRTFVVAGEAFQPRLAQQWRAIAPAATIVNEYGPTETVVGCAVHDVTAATVDGRPLPIGRPIANTRMYVLDRAGLPLPPGAIGELYIGGAGVARGYRGRPGLTADRFVPDAVSGRSGARLYRTGDLARQRPDGAFEFLGRRDDQVKLRGYRIEFGEVEARLAEVPEVADAAAAVRDGRLVGYVVPAPGAVVDPARIRAALSDVLPDYMVPALIVGLDRVPRALSGKTDRGALPDPEARAVGGDRPRTPTEAALAAVWSAVLNVEEVGVDEHFFDDLGGDSLMVILAVSLARDAGLDVGLPQAMRHPTIAALAASIDAGENAAGEAEAAEDRSS
jgi:amino acid adenylation domain-containing protein/non-ribosomal peptide synthase protein (TIGR01720 family)